MNEYDNKETILHCFIEITLIHIYRDVSHISFTIFSTPESYITRQRHKSGLKTGGVMGPKNSISENSSLLESDLISYSCAL